MSRGKNMIPAGAHRGGSRLEEVAPELNRILTRAAEPATPPPIPAVRCETVWVTMRDGVRLATDVYFPPRVPAPTIVMRTPYGRARKAEMLMALAQRGYVVISQDCRGTGESEPDAWDYYIYEPEDSFDFIEWVTQRSWFDGFVGSCGGSYLASTQWCMAAHPRMSAIVPEVGGLGVTIGTVRNYMFINAYARTVGKGAGKVSIHYTDMERRMAADTLAGGYFNEPLQQSFVEAVYERYPTLRTLPAKEGIRWLWKRYCASPPAERVELLKLAFGVSSFTYLEMNSLDSVFGQHVTHGVHALPCVDPTDVCNLLYASTLMVTGWYDWNLDDTLATWDLLSAKATEPLRSRIRLLIAPSAHNVPGYHEGAAAHPELQRTYRTADIIDLLCRWYATVRNEAISSWPAVVYYLMGANEWHTASAWPPPDAHRVALHLAANNMLTTSSPQQSTAADTYTYDPDDPTPTVGGSIVSSVYPPGSVDLSKVQSRSDVLTYTTEVLDEHLDLVGPLQLILYASSSAVDTDFAARISDVFPDGRAIQLQSGILRARYRHPKGNPELLIPGKTYRFEIDMWATANRFKAGHRLRLDLSSADFPRFDRHSNRGGESGPSIRAVQTIYRDAEHPSHLVISVIGGSTIGHRIDERASYVRS